MFEVGEVCFAWVHPKYQKRLSLPSWVEVTLTERGTLADWVTDFPTQRGGWFEANEHELRKKPKPGDQSFDELINTLKDKETA